MKWKFHAITAIASAPQASPISAPAGPAFGRNSVSGKTSTSHPTAHPNAIAHAPNAERWDHEFLSVICILPPSP